jgi:hypothetical protein
LSAAKNVPVTMVIASFSLDQAFARGEQFLGRGKIQAGETVSRDSW